MTTDEQRRREEAYRFAYDLDYYLELTREALSEAFDQVSSELKALGVPDDRIESRLAGVTFSDDHSNEPATQKKLQRIQKRISELRGVRIRLRDLERARSRRSWKVCIRTAIDLGLLTHSALNEEVQEARKTLVEQSARGAARAKARSEEIAQQDALQRPKVRAKLQDLIDKHGMGLTSAREHIKRKYGHTMFKILQYTSGMKAR